nr:hypothetical protein CFP56_19038 [Quercus suber]
MPNSNTDPPLLAAEIIEKTFSFCEQSLTWAAIIYKGWKFNIFATISVQFDLCCQPAIICKGWKFNIFATINIRWSSMNTREVEVFVGVL